MEAIGYWYVQTVICSASLCTTLYQMPVTLLEGPLSIMQYVSSTLVFLLPQYLSPWLSWTQSCLCTVLLKATRITVPRHVAVFIK